VNLHSSKLSKLIMEPESRNFLSQKFSVQSVQSRRSSSRPLRILFQYDSTVSGQPMVCKINDDHFVESDPTDSTSVHDSQYSARNTRAYRSIIVDEGQ
jgi:hypothetical protein